MANEVRSQRLMQFLQVASNPVLAPFAKMDYIIREIAKAMDLDPDKITNNLQDCKLIFLKVSTTTNTTRTSSITRYNRLEVET